MRSRSPIDGAETIHLLLVDPPGAGRIDLMREIEACEDVVALAAAADAEEALRMLRERRFDAVLFGVSSQQEPGLSGLAKARFAAVAAPIIAVASESDGHLGRRALRLGAQDYLIRSELTPGLLSRTIHYAIERHRVLSELRSARLREHHLATHDALTGILNRAAFLDHLTRSVAQARRYRKQLAVLFIDVDGFKRINDTLGHDAGDHVLRAVAERLVHLTRESDACGRHGGDEFLMCLHGVTSGEGPGIVARKLLHAMAEPFPVGGAECRLAGSIGIALHPRDGADPETLVRRADVAMYEAKSSGGDAYAGYDADGGIRVWPIARNDGRPDHQAGVIGGGVNQDRRFAATESA